MKKYIKPAVNVPDIDLSDYLDDDLGGHNTIVAKGDDLAKGNDEWVPEEEIEDDDWW